MPIKLAAILLALLLVVLPAKANQEEGFLLVVPPQVRPYQPEPILLTLPRAATVTLYAQQGMETLQLSEALPLPAGRHEWMFQGLTALLEPLPRGETTIVASFQTDENTSTVKTNTQVLSPGAGIMYALLSREQLPAMGGEDLYIDHQVAKPGKLSIQLFAKGQEQALRSWYLDRQDALPRAFRWDKTVAGKPASAGEYEFVLSMQGASQQALRLPFQLTDEPATQPALSPTPEGLFLPSSRQDEDVWAAMMAPVAVLTIGDMQHQKVYEKPDSASPTLGIIHGQTAGLQVLATDVAGFTQVQVARHGDGQWITGYVPTRNIQMVQPAQRYGLVLDKGSQRLTLYEQGRAVGSLSISTGVYVPPGESSFETLAGAYLTQDRIASFPHSGYRFDYAMRIDGGNLLHAAGYKLQNGAKDYQDHQANLSQKASHGCVRIDNREQGGINAWWLYANLPRNTKVLVLPEDFDSLVATTGQSDTPRLTDSQHTQALDDQAYPAPDVTSFQDFPALLEADQHTASPFLVMPEDWAEDSIDTPLNPPVSSPDAANESLKTKPADEAVVITLSFGGDSVLGSEEHSKNKPDSFHSIVAEKGMGWPFSGMDEVFGADDLSMVNLENVLLDTKRSQQQRLHNFRGPTSFANILTQGSIELVNIANNHFNDYGQEGKNATRQALQAEGIAHSGQSSLHIYEKDGIRIGFAGIRETVFHQGRGRIADEIRQLKEAGSHYIVYTCHFGNEYEARHNQLQTLMAHTAIDAGANLVIGHHPHVVQGIEEYKGRLIFYSLGNLVFGGNLELSTFDGLVVQVKLVFVSQTLESTKVQLIPVLTSSSIPDNNFRPVPAQGADKKRILGLINQDSDKTYSQQFKLP